MSERQPDLFEGAGSPAGLFFHALHLRNIFCYAEERVELGGGVSMFAGANGSGKSSLLEALFFALFASGARSVTGRELAEVLREGEREGAVTLDFSFGAHRYTAHLALRRLKHRVQADGERCTLERDDGQRWVKVGEVTQQLQRLLHMDSEDFANCAYVRQGEVDRILQAKPQDRQSMLDRLLRLDQLDDYDRRLKDGALRALNKRAHQLEGGLEKVRQDLSALEQQELPGQKARLERELGQLDAQQQRVQRQHLDLGQELLTLTQRQSQFEQTAQRVERARAKLKELEGELQRRDAEEKRLRQEVRERETRRAEDQRAWQALQREPLWTELALRPEEPLAERLTALDRALEGLETDLQAQRDELTAARTELKSLAPAQAELEAQRAEREEVLAAARAELVPLEGQLSALLTAPERDQLDSLGLEPALQQLKDELEAQRAALASLKEEKAKATATLDRLGEERQRAQALIAGGRCPTCHQVVSAENLGEHLDQLEQSAAEQGARRERLEGALAAEGAKLDGLKRQQARLERAHKVLLSWTERRRDAQRLQAELAELRARLARGRDKEVALKEQEEGALARGKQLKERHGRLKLQRQFVQTVQRHREAWVQSEQHVQTRRQIHREFLRHSDAMRQERLQLEEQLEALQAQLGELDPAALQARIDALRERHAGLQAQLEDLQRERDLLQRALGDLERALKRLEELERQVEAQRRRGAALATLRQEVEQLQGLYAEVKRSQRLRNLEALNAVFNHFFELMYFGPAYASVQLSEEFQIEVIRKDGQPLSPALLSGGERALVNLALRAAIHRTLSEAGGVALPLLFDEPTVFLDAHHVHQLERLFEELGKRVGQVIVVSHEASLVEGADHEYLVEKDGDNLGHITRVR